MSDPLDFRKDCVFCNRSSLRGEILFENQSCYHVSSMDPILVDAGMVVPKRHVASLFALSEREWSDVRTLLLEAKAVLEKRKPSGFNVGWNDGVDAGQSANHAHLHIIARFPDEPLRGKGIRHFFKQPSNRRGIRSPSGRRESASG